MTVRELPLVDLARRCREETLRFLGGGDRDDAFCFEIFHRAVVDRDDAAWEAIVAQYRGIVLAYVSQHSAAALLREADDYWVNRAFQRFWAAVGPDRFGNFPDLPSLLKYLKLCVHSVLMDEMRARRGTSTSSLDDVPESVPARTNAEGAVVGALSGEQLWDAIIREVQDEAERKVVYLSFARDMKPSEIAERHPDLFGSVADVYRIKRNVIERLRRSAEIRSFLVA
ncbi:MAG: sigma-70 family RNA polymerase sigma factor [Chloroflexi bacterium]|nr:sigma-70 family RNA polymerase sigma factor [Chloroflexota bacterium]